MLSTVTVTYRGSQSRTLSNLSRVNVITGRGAGKTSFLQGVRMLLLQNGAVGELCRMRHMSLAAMVSYGFYVPVRASGVFRGVRISLCAEPAARCPRGYTIRTEEGVANVDLDAVQAFPFTNAVCSVRMPEDEVSPAATWEAAEWVKKVDPNVTLRIASGCSRWEWHGRYVLMQDLSATDRFTIQLACAFEDVQDGVLLVDCFGDGIHPDVQPVLAEMVHTLSEKYNVQVFLVTQSLESIRELGANLMKLYKFAENVVVEFDEADAKTIREMESLDPR